MNEIILVKDGELTLKGLNRRTFEDTLSATITRRLKPYGNFKQKRAQSTLYIEPQNNNCDLEGAMDTVGKIFGIAGYTRALVCEKNFDTICQSTTEYLKEELEQGISFKVEAKRADKHFPMKSPEICMELGGYILEKFPQCRVDVHNPQLTVYVEIRDFGAYIHKPQLKGAGGLPVGTAGRAAVLISGGIDSPVAAYTMAKRGLVLDAIHFASPPYTSARAEEKVITLLSKVAKYSGIIKLAIVPFTEIQEQIKDNCKEDYFTLIMRRFMMRIAQKIAAANGSLALITGESLGQVASQTLPAIASTDEVCTMPVFRPLIGSDKDEIVAISKKIDAFETSILPYEDCCTVFTPPHPHTKPKPGQCAEVESVLPIDELINKALSGVRYMLIGPEGYIKDCIE